MCDRCLVSLSRAGLEMSLSQSSLQRDFSVHSRTYRGLMFVQSKLSLKTGHRPQHYPPSVRTQACLQHQARIPMARLPLPSFLGGHLDSESLFCLFICLVSDLPLSERYLPTFVFSQLPYFTKHQPPQDMPMW